MNDDEIIAYIRKLSVEEIETQFPFATKIARLLEEKKGRKTLPLNNAKTREGVVVDE